MINLLYSETVGDRRMTRADAADADVMATPTTKRHHTLPTHQSSPHKTLHFYIGQNVKFSKKKNRFLNPINCVT